MDIHNKELLAMFDDSEFCSLLSMSVVTVLTEVLTDNFEIIKKTFLLFVGLTPFEVRIWLTCWCFNIYLQFLCKFYQDWIGYDQHLNHWLAIFRVQTNISHFSIYKEVSKMSAKRQSSFDSKKSKMQSKVAKFAQ